MKTPSVNHSLSIVIPMYNEEKMAAKCVDAVMKIVKKLNNTILIVVNDGSVDKTQEILKQKYKEYKEQFLVLTHEKNKGFGAALQTGIEESISQGYEFYLTMDSDLTNDPGMIPVFAKYMSPLIDCLKASRYIKGGRVIGVPLYRRIISSVGNSVASFLLNIGIKDCTNGFKMVRLSLLKGVKFKENNFSIILEEIYYLKKRHARFAEIPYTLTARTNTKSHFSYKP